MQIYLTISEFARYAQLSDKTIKSFVDNGWVEAIQMPNGRFRLPSKELSRFLCEQDYQLALERISRDYRKFQ